MTKRKRKTISLSTRRSIWEKYNRRCKICGAKTSLCQPLNRYDDSTPMAHIDHILPFSLGGKCEENNFRLLCSVCNLSIKNTMCDSKARGLLYV